MDNDEPRNEEGVVERLQRDYAERLSQEAPGAHEDVPRRQFLTFLLGRELCAAETIYCREVIRVPTIVPVPRLPAHILGVINLRGKVVSVSDVRILLGIERPPRSRQSRLVLVGNGVATTALLAERVGAIFEVREDEVQELPPDAGGGKRPFMGAHFMLDGERAGIIDVERLFACPEMRFDGKRDKKEP